MAKELWETEWRDILEKVLIENFIIFDGVSSINFGSFFAWLSCMGVSEQSNTDISEESDHELLAKKRKELHKRREDWIEKLAHDLDSDEPETVIRAELSLLELAFQKILRFDLRINDALFELIKGNIGCSINEKAAVTRAAVWALYWLHFNYAGEEGYCQPSGEQIEYLYSVIECSESGKYAVSRSIDLLGILQLPDRMEYRFTSKDRLYNWAILADTGERREVSQKFYPSANEKLIENLVTRLDDEEKKVRERAALVLGRFNIWKEKAVQPLLDLLHEDGMDDETEIETIEYLGCIRCSDAIAGLIEELENEDSEVRFYAMLALVGLGDSRAVDLLLTKLDHPQAEIRQYIATILGTLDDLRVPDAFTKLLEDKNDYVKKKCREILKRTCQDLFKKGEYISVLDTLRPLIESEPQDIELLQVKYDCFFNTASYEKALEVAEQMVTSDCETLFLLRNKALCLKKLDRKEEALKITEEAIALAVSPHEILKDVEFALSLAPDRIDLLKKKFSCLSDLEHYEKVLETVNAAISVAPEDLELWGQKFTCLKKLERHEEALSNLDTALLYVPEDKSLEVLRAKINELIQTEKYDEAVETIEHSLSFSSHQVELLQLKSFCLQKQGRIKEAEEVAVQAYSLDPESYENMLDESIQQIRNNPGLYKEVERNMNEFLSEDLLNIEYLKQYFLLSCLVGLYDGVELAIDKAISFEQNKSELWGMKGLCLWFKRAFEEALNAFEQALDF